MDSSDTSHAAQFSLSGHIRSRRWFAITVGVLAGGAFLLLASTAQGRRRNDERAEARALIQRALDVSDIRAPGSTAFELRGTITIPLKDSQSATGSYLLDWVSPDRWREEIHVANYSRIRVGGAGQYWQLRSPDYELMSFDTFTRGINLTQALRAALLEPYWDNHSKVKVALRRRKLNGAPADCVSIASDATDFCFDSRSGVPLRNGTESWQMTRYSAYQDFVGKLVPGTLEMSVLKHPVASFKLQSITNLDHPRDDLFAPPPGAESWPSCDAAVRPKFIRGTHPAPRSGAAEGTVLIYGVLGTDGRFHNLKILESPSEDMSEAVMKSWQSAVYQPETCHGVPEEMEGIGMATITRQ